MAREPAEITERRRALGRRLATFRRAARLTQAELAHRLHYQRASLSNIENGHQPSPRQFWQRVDTVLVANGVLLDGYDELAAAKQAHQAALAGKVIMPAGVAGHGTLPVDATDRDPMSPLNRRALLTQGFPAAATLGVGMSLSSQSAVQSRTETIGVDVATELSAVAGCYRRSYRNLPAMSLLAAARAHLDLVSSLRPELQPESTQKKLLTVVGETAALTGVLLLLDMNQPTEAWPYLDLAWAAAKEVESAELQAVVLCSRSFGIAYTADDHWAGLELARMAWDVAAGGACAETRGWVAAVASERCASLGDLDGCLRFLEQARRALDAVPDDDAPWLGIGGFDAAKLSAYEGGDMVRLGRYRDAEPALDGAIEHLGPAMQRHRCTALIDRAEARLGASEIDGACHDATAALDLVMQVQHAGNFQRLHALARRAHDTHAAVGRELWRHVLAATAEPNGFAS